MSKKVCHAEGCKKTTEEQILQCFICDFFYHQNCTTLWPIKKGKNFFFRCIKCTTEFATMPLTNYRRFKILQIEPELELKTKLRETTSTSTIGRYSGLETNEKNDENDEFVDTEPDFFDNANQERNFLSTLNTTCYIATLPNREEFVANPNSIEECKNCYSPLLNGEENLKYIWSRWNSFHASWGVMNTQIQEIIEDLNFKDLKGVCSFITSAYRSGTSQLLPCAVIATGLSNPQGYADLFKQIGNYINRKHLIDPPIALLRSKQCPNIKATVTLSMNQFVRDQFNKNENLKNEHSIRGEVSWDSLISWYKENIQSHGFYVPSSNSTAPSPLERVPLIIVLEDFESFDSAVVQDYLYICHSYQNSLPFVIVLGIATSIDAVAKVLPRSVSSLLSLKSFVLQRSDEYVDAIVSKVLLSPQNPVRLSVATMSLLIKTFDHHHKSVQQFCSGLKYAILQHYLTQPLSFWVVSDEAKTSFIETLANLSLQEKNPSPQITSSPLENVTNSPNTPDAKHTQYSQITPNVPNTPETPPNTQFTPNINAQNPNTENPPSTPNLNNTPSTPPNTQYTQNISNISSIPQNTSHTKSSPETPPNTQSTQNTFKSLFSSSPHIHNSSYSPFKNILFSTAKAYQKSPNRNYDEIIDESTRDIPYSEEEEEIFFGQRQNDELNDDDLDFYIDELGEYETEDEVFLREDNKGRSSADDLSDVYFATDNEISKDSSPDDVIINEHSGDISVNMDNENYSYLTDDDSVQFHDFENDPNLYEEIEDIEETLDQDTVFFKEISKSDININNNNNNSNNSSNNNNNNNNNNNDNNAAKISKRPVPEITSKSNINTCSYPDTPKIDHQAPNQKSTQQKEKQKEKEKEKLVPFLEPSSLSTQHIDYIRKLTSFRKFMKEQKSVSMSNFELAKKAEIWRHDISAFFCGFSVVFQCLILAIRKQEQDDDRSSLSLAVYYVYILNHDERPLKLVINYFKNSTQPNLLYITNEWLRILENCLELQQSRYQKTSMLEKLMSYQSILKELIKKQENPNTNDTEKSTTDSNLTMQFPKNWGPEKKRAEALKLIQETDSDPLQPMKIGLQNLLKKFTKDFLFVDLYSFPLIESVLFTKDKTLRRLLLPQHLTCIKSALKDHTKYLTCPCCIEKKETQKTPEKNNEIEKQAIDEVEPPKSSMEDIVIAYRIYLDCGKYVNLHDWYLSFCQVCTGSFDVDLNSDSLKHIQARFSLALDTLNMLGFIQRTERRLDHIVKLVPDF